MSTYHLLVRQLSSLDAAALPHCLLVPLALGVTEQVHLGGDLQTHGSKVNHTENNSKRERDPSGLDSNDVAILWHILRRTVAVLG